MSELSIVTTQNVTINFNSASVGERIFGQLLDLVVKIAYGLVVFMVFFYYLNLDEYIERLDRWSGIAIYVIFYLPVMFYTLVQESVFEGQTIGKRIMKTRVIKIDGYQAGFGDYLMRWLFRIVDLSIGQGIIGLIAVLVSNKGQRLGDMAAGTAVITLKNNITIDHTILKEIEKDYIPTYSMVIKLTDNDIRIIKETFETSLESADFEMITRLKVKIEQVTGIKSAAKNDTAFVTTVLKDYNYYTQKM